MAGDQLAAGAARPGDQHGKGLVGDTADGLVRFLHPRAAAELDGFAKEFFVRAASPPCRRRCGQFAHQPGNFIALVDHVVEVFARSIGAER